MIKKFHLSLNMMSSRYFRAFRELSEEYRARDNRVLYFALETLSEHGTIYSNSFIFLKRIFFKP